MMSASFQVLIDYNIDLVARDDTAIVPRLDDALVLEHREMRLKFVP